MLKSGEPRHIFVDPGHPRRPEAQMGVEGGQKVAVDGGIAVVAHLIDKVDHVHIVFAPREGPLLVEIDGVMVVAVHLGHDALHDTFDVEFGAGVRVRGSQSGGK